MTPITPELLAEIKRLDEKATKGEWTFGRTGEGDRMIIGGPSRKYICHVQIWQTPRHMGEWEEGERLANADLLRLARALPALARRAEELEAERDHWRECAEASGALLVQAHESTTAAEQQRDEAVKALEAVDGDLSLLLIAIESGDARGELLTRALFAKRDVERALTPKEPT